MPEWTIQRACKELGVPEDASQDQIQKAWKRRALETHPDRAGKTSQKKFIRAREAYEFLQGRPSEDPGVHGGSTATDAPLEDSPVDVGTWLQVLELTIDDCLVQGHHRAQVVVVDDEVLVAVYLDVGSKFFSSAGQVKVLLRQERDAPAIFDKPIVQRSMQRGKVEAVWFSPLEHRQRLDGTDASIPRPTRYTEHMRIDPASRPSPSWQDVLYGGFSGRDGVRFAWWRR